jgi:hypothetical protein
MIHTSKQSKNDTSCNPAELLKIMSFYSAMQPGTRTPDLLKMSGFKIAGLRGIKAGPEAKTQTKDHKLAWNESLGFGICTCFRWVGETWTHDITAAQHKTHARKALGLVYT